MGGHINISINVPLKLFPGRVRSNVQLPFHRTLSGCVLMMVLWWERIIRV
jgi:hypothetical protein